MNEQQLTAVKQALEVLERLWGIIDDIDTYGDMAKADEKLYRKLVERRQRQRFEETGISTDGYELHGGAITALRAIINQEEAQPAVPLTDEQIDDIWNRYCDEMGEASVNEAYDIAHAIEAAHGITAPPTQGETK
jgi:hypothetical protein